MNKTSTFLIHNLWWLVPLAVVLLFWQHTAPILLMLVFAYLGRIILNPVISILDQWIGSRKWSVVIVMVLLIICLAILSSSIFPLIGKQITAFQSTMSMETLTKFQAKLTLVLESIFPVFLFNITKKPFSVTKKIYFPSMIGVATDLTSFSQFIIPVFKS